MPWQCPNPGCGALVPLDSVQACPVCEASKPGWTIIPDQTRDLVVAIKKKVDCRRGRLLSTTAAAPFTHLGASWLATREASVISKAAARRRAAQRLLPDPFDLLQVRLRPPKTGSWTLKVTTLFDTSRAAEQELEFQVDPDTLGDGGDFVAHFLCVSGPGGPDGISFPSIHVLDVTEDTALGHAPRLQVTGLRAKPITIDLVRQPAQRLVECQRGGLLSTSAGAPSPHLGVAWRETDTIAVLAKQDALARREARLPPEPRAVLRVRLRPHAPSLVDVTVTIAFSSRAHERIDLRLDVPPEALEEDGAVSVDFVCVHGDEDVSGLAFPFVHVLDVTEATALGHAPTLEVASSGADPILLQLETLLPVEPAVEPPVARRNA